MSHPVNDKAYEDIYEYLYELFKREPTLKEMQKEFERRSR